MVLDLELINTSACLINIMHEAESNSRTDYNYLKENPQYLLSLLSKYVKVELIKNRTIHGYIHSIDPMKYSIILLEQQSEKFHTTIIPGHAIVDVSVMNAELNTQPPKRKISTSTVDSNVLERKQKLMSWFKQNLLPVTESEDNILFGNVIILPPYNISDICTDNLIVAMQVKNIMNKMPENFFGT